MDGCVSSGVCAGVCLPRVGFLGRRVAIIFLMPILLLLLSSQSAWAKSDRYPLLTNKFPLVRVSVRPFEPEQGDLLTLFLTSETGFESADQVRVVLRGKLGGESIPLLHPAPKQWMTRVGPFVRPGVKRLEVEVWLEDAKEADQARARISELGAEIADLFDTIDRVFGNQKLPEAVITSTNDGKHMEGSKHCSNEAIDIRGNNVTDEQMSKAADSLKEALGPDYDVVPEFYKDQPARDHIHVEYDPKSPSANSSMQPESADQK